MLKLVRLISFACLLFTGSLFGFHPKPGGWLIDAEYLYLKPSIDDTYYVVVGGGASPLTIRDGQLKNNDFCFHSGFRVGGGYAFCNCNREFLVFYTRLHARQNRTISGNLISASMDTAAVLPFENFAGSASSKLHLLYQRVDGLLSQQIFCGCRLNLYLFGGLEWAQVRFREKYHYASAISVRELDLDQRARVWGIGPQVGIDANYGLYEFTCARLPGKLSLQGWASGSLLVAKSHERAFDTDTGVIVLNVRDDHTWRLVPALHARLGVNYATCFSCFAGSLEVGYEFNSYIRGLRRMFFPDDVAVNLTTFQDFNFDLHGLYIAADFTF